MIRRVLSFVAGLACASPVWACDIALVLAVDVSGSVDPEEYEIQMQGLALALGDSAVSEALVRAQARVMVLQWTGTGRQIVSIPWQPVETFADADQLAVEVAAAPRSWRNFSTAIGEALQVAIVAFELPEVADCKRHVIDVSGDGPSNEGMPPEVLRDIAAARGITINALAIEETEQGLADYYRRHVITGRDSFAVAAATFEAYPARIRQKLLREIVLQVAQIDPP